MKTEIIYNKYILRKFRDFLISYGFYNEVKEFCKNYDVNIISLTHSSPKDMIDEILVKMCIKKRPFTERESLIDLNNLWLLEIINDSKIIPQHRINAIKLYNYINRSSYSWEIKYDCLGRKIYCKTNKELINIKEFVNNLKYE